MSHVPNLTISTHVMTDIAAHVHCHHNRRYTSKHFTTHVTHVTKNNASPKNNVERAIEFKKYFKIKEMDRTNATLFSIIVKIILRAEIICSTFFSSCKRDTGIFKIKGTKKLFSKFTYFQSK